MASSTWHTIALQGEPVRREALAHEAITPGQLLEINSDEEVAKHSADSGVLPGKLFALESPTAAASTTAAIDTNYAAADVVYFGQFQPGDVVYGFLKNGETVVKGITQLVSDGAGAVKAVSVGTSTLEGSVVGVADQDLTASGATRCRIRIT
jgi:hypothetical protein